jgi:protein SCO1/2
MPNRRTALIAALVFVLALLAMAAYAVYEMRERPIEGAGWDTSSEGAPIGGAFELTDHAGKRVTQADYAGKYLLVFFGFTHCPDVCPRAMDQFAGAMDALGDDASLVQPILITVDPERDTPQVLADYVAPFNAAGANIVGLTGTPEEIAAVETLYRAYARKVETGEGEGEYTMDHSAIIYLMGPDGGFLTLFDGSDAPDAMAAEIAAAIDDHS